MTDPSSFVASGHQSCGAPGTDWPALPTETDIFILADGRVVVADLPAELAPLAVALGDRESCEIAHDQPDPAA
jgi:hypothetical protein